MACWSIWTSQWIAGQIACSPATPRTSETPAAAKRCSTSAIAPSRTTPGAVSPSTGSSPRARSRKPRTTRRMRSLCSRMACTARVGALVARAPCGELLRAAGDHAERRGDLVGDPHGERAHHRGAVRDGELRVPPAREGREGELALEQHAAPLSAERRRPEEEHEPHRQRTLKTSRSRRALLPIAHPLGAAHDRDPPAPEGPRVDRREPGGRAAVREAQGRRLRTAEPDGGLPRVEGPPDRIARHLAPVRRPQAPSPGALTRTRTAPARSTRAPSRSFAEGTSRPWPSRWLAARRVSSSDATLPARVACSRAKSSSAAADSRASSQNASAVTAATASTMKAISEAGLRAASCLGSDGDEGWITVRETSA